MKVLYVEDDNQDADLTTRALMNCIPDCSINRVNSQAGAVQQLQEKTYDVLLTDLRLPDGSGMALLQHVKDIGNSIAVVIITGRGDEETVVAALQAGADDYVVKRGDYLTHLPGVLEDAVSRNQDAAQRKNNQLRVLYAEPNKADVDLTQRHFARFAPHITIETVNYGTEVLTRLTTQPMPYDILLFDYRLPGLSGLDLLKEIRQIHHLALPVVLVTGRGDEHTARQALKLGADNYVVKSPGYMDRLPFILENTLIRRRIEHERDQYRNLFNRVPVGLYRTTPGGKLLSANPALVEMFGYPDQNALLSVPVTDLYADPYARQEFITQLRKHGHLRDVEIQTRRRDGSLFWVSLDATITAGNNNETGVIEGVVEDITDRKQTHERMAHQDRLAAMGRLAGGIAHDFNNILAAIILYAQLPLSQQNLSHTARKSLTTILEQSQRAAELINQILDFSRRAMIKTHPLSLVDLSMEASSLLRRTIPESITLSTEMAEDTCMIQADATRMHQVLMNLCINAVDAMPHGGSLSITVKPLYIAPDEIPPMPDMRPGTWAILSISDTGTGMTEAVRARLFEPFFTTKDIGKGTGLGLAQVYGIVKQHHGFINVQTAPGQGTTFVIYLPRIGDKRPPADQTIASGPPRGRNETILVVEDMESLRQAIESGLTELNYHVVSATNGDEALALWHQEQVDLCLTDIGMPGMGGLELLHRLRVQSPNLKVIAMTGYVVESGAEELLNAGFAGILYKPFSVKDLAESVRTALDKEHRQRVD